MSRSLQQTIHVGCKELGLDQDARRELQLAVTGKASMSEMTEPELIQVLGRLKEDGFTPFEGASKGPGKRPLAPRSDLRLIHVLWKKLGEAGALKRPGRDGLNAFIRSRFEAHWESVPIDVDQMRNHEQIDAVIQALKSWGQRRDIDFNWEDHAR